MKSALYSLTFLIIIGCKSQQATESSVANRFSGSSVGCGNFQIFVMDSTGRSYLQIGLDATAARFDDHNQFLVGESTIEVVVKEFDGDISNQPCNDIMSNDPPGELASRVGLSGRVTIRLDAENRTKYETGEPYRVTIHLDQVVVEGIPGPISMIVENVVVGWMPG